MSTAVYTVRSLAELRAIKQPHPLRSVTDGDFVQLIGDRFRDDCAFFQAQITDSPVEVLPASIASDDNKIQWNKVSHGFFHGSVPNSINMAGRFSGTTPSGWSEERIRNRSYSLGYMQESMNSRSHSCEHVNGKIWITSDNIIELDISTLSSVVHPVGTLTDGSTQLLDMGRCYSKSEDKIHIIDTAGNHHLFDVATTTMTLAAKAAYPAVVDDNIMIDASQQANKLFYLSKAILQPYDLYEYNIGTDAWTHITVGPAALAAWAPDPFDSNKFIVVFDGNGVYELDAVTSTLTLKHNITAYGTVAQPNYIPAAMIWDEFSGKFYVPNRYEYMLYYDPLTGDTGTCTDDVFDTLLDRAIGASMAVHIGDGVYFFLDDDETNNYWAVVLSPFFNFQKERP